MPRKARLLRCNGGVTGGKGGVVGDLRINIAIYYFIRVFYLWWDSQDNRC